MGLLNKLLALGVALALSACATSSPPAQKLDQRLEEPAVNTVTSTQYQLHWLPGPREPVPVAVYGVSDETGAFKASDSVQTLSRAVTQGPTSILIKALQDAGDDSWFKVIERQKLDNLLKERQIILEMRQRYLGESPLQTTALPSLLFAGILIEGAITGYDTNLKTGGAGAQYLGIGAHRQYREDSVSVYLRAVSVKTGEILLSVNAEQRILSVATQGSVFRFVAFQELLEMEAGYTTNEPRHIAVRQAFEKAVYSLIVDGAREGLWSFADPRLGDIAIAEYERRYINPLAPKRRRGVPDEFFAARDENFAQMLAAREETLMPVAAPVADRGVAVPEEAEEAPSRGIFDRLFGRRTSAAEESGDEVAQSSPLVENDVQRVSAAPLSDELLGLTADAPQTTVDTVQMAAVDEAYEAASPVAVGVKAPAKRALIHLAATANGSVGVTQLSPDDAYLPKSGGRAPVHLVAAAASTGPERVAERGAVGDRAST